MLWWLLLLLITKLLILGMLVLASVLLHLYTQSRSVCRRDLAFGLLGCFRASGFRTLALNKAPGL